MIYLKSYRMFESTQDGVTPEQRSLLNDSCQPYQENGQMVNPADAWWVDPESGLVTVGGNFILRRNWKEGQNGTRRARVYKSLTIGR